MDFEEMPLRRDRRGCAGWAAVCAARRAPERRLRLFGYSPFSRLRSFCASLFRIAAVVFLVTAPVFLVQVLGYDGVPRSLPCRHIRKLVVPSGNGLDSLVPISLRQAPVSVYELQDA